ncbi:putative methyltransferase, mitochondrial [Vitis vinifera]|uniref:Putative methyltransferase, mitochondrial n=1 Tax=Vitis vinifera TaxID=29760 RepID=A0A438FYC0_VITVI|nr:putative methyltransferase, mitochondrial [Vitis vinifera]
MYSWWLLELFLLLYQSTLLGLIFVENVVRDAGNLLTRAGFTLPSVDVDEYTVKYRSALDLIEHLRSMGETNALLQKSNILKRETALATAAVYDSMFAGEDGTIPATFQVIYMTGWREHSSQQKAKRRGSATVSFQDIQNQFGSDS